MNAMKGRCEMTSKTRNASKAVYQAVRVIVEGYYAGVILLSRDSILRLMVKGESFTVNGSTVTWNR
jgi:hypothetical protein